MKANLNASAGSTSPPLFADTEREYIMHESIAHSHTLQLVCSYESLNQRESVHSHYCNPFTGINQQQEQEKQKGFCRVEVKKSSLATMDKAIRHKVRQIETVHVATTLTFYIYFSQANTFQLDCVALLNLS